MDGMIDPELCRLVGFGAEAEDESTDRAALAVLGLLALALWIGGLAWT